MIVVDCGSVVGLISQQVSASAQLLCCGEQYHPLTMDAIVQFVRNALCTAKNFNVLGSTFLYDPNVTARYYKFPSPMDQTTPLEILISITQLYALVSVSIAGYKMISNSIKKLQLISRLVSLQVERKKDETKKDKNEVVARRIVTESLLEESDAAIRSFFVGVNVFAIGITFVWLSANSYHVTSTDWIGGVAGLIHALTVAEIALIVLLYYMVKDARDSMRKSKDMKEFAANLCKSKGFADVDVLTVEEFGWLSADDNGTSPLFWTDGDVPNDVVTDGKMLTKAEDSVATKLSKLAKTVDPQVAENLTIKSELSRFEGLREYLYLVLNFFAFYGYGACILVYYFQDEKTQPSFLKAALLHLPNTDADWLGNAVGDFMWTVEPIVILGSPLVMQSIAKNDKKKEKVA